MTQTFSVVEAQTRLRELLAQALAGNDIIITEHRHARSASGSARSALEKKRVAGLNRGSIWTSEDFDEALPNEFWLGHE
jgi:antitoxin (DNA-binding transcriptional repressor) of toxin-antitoxin stability system